MKKPMPFIAFLLPVKNATQRKSCPEAPLEVSLMADLLAVFVRSLATPQIPWAITTQATDITTDQSVDNAESNKKPVICVTSPTVSIRVMP